MRGPPPFFRAQLLLEPAAPGPRARSFMGTQTAIDLGYAGLALTAFVLALGFVPLAREAGRRFGFVDAVHPDKIHTEPVVRCGGAGIFLAFMGSLGLALTILAFAGPHLPLPAALQPYAGNIAFEAPRLGAVLAGASFVFLVGLYDDRRPLRPLTKLALQIVACIPLILAGISVRLFLPYDWMGYVVTVGWVVLLTNSLNLLDNMNGLSAGVAAIAAVNFFLVARAGDSYFLMAMFALVAGAVAGFLPFNFPRASVFMGDSGALFLGYMLAASSILMTYYDAASASRLPVAAPLVILAIPFFDTATVVYVRWRKGLPLMKGDQNHFSHRLVALGFTRVQAVLFIYLLTFAIGLNAVTLRNQDTAGALLTLAQTALILLAIFLLETAGRRRAEQPPA